MLTEWQKLKKEAEASTHPDIDLLNFVSRGKLIVLQTSPDAFEIMTKEEKLNSLHFMELSLNALRVQIHNEAT
jgi:hypothetical protein